MIFNWEFYVNYYNDLISNGIINEELATTHFQKYGKNEKRIYVDIPIFFDWKLYLELNKDLKKNINTEYQAWSHFLYDSKKENRKIYHKIMLNKYCVY